ncbi:MAG: hypothetical protein RIC89_07125 [Pseudomonadales bacterium]
METLPLFPDLPAKPGASKTDAEQRQAMGKQIAGKQATGATGATGKETPQTDPHMKIAMDLAAVLQERARRERARAAGQRLQTWGRKERSDYQRAREQDAYAHAICDHLLASLRGTPASNEPQAQRTQA